MKALFFLFCLTIPLMANAPKKPLPSRYAALYTSSPFTTPAPPDLADTTPQINPMDEWALGGVTKFPDGFFVILLNKKKPDEKKNHPARCALRVQSPQCQRWRHGLHEDDGHLAKW